MKISASLGIVLASLLVPQPARAQFQTKPTILVPTEKCPGYTDLAEKYFTSMSKRTGLLGCMKLYDERLRLLTSMLAYGQNISCYSAGWKQSEVVSFLQGLINRNHLERNRCEAWLASGRVCQDGNVCPADTICTTQHTCVAKPAEPTTNASTTKQ